MCGGPDLCYECLLGCSCHTSWEKPNSLCVTPLDCSPQWHALQVEGGFVFGLGMMLQEHVDYSKEGQPLYDSTWDYKIPTAACIPRQFNIALLKVGSRVAPVNDR